MTKLIGESLGRYHILEQLGEGGMAIVYKAYDTRLERDVAIKIIRKGAFPTEQLEQVLTRFEREAKALARLSHPNVIKILDYGEYEGSPYLVMEYFPGGTLKRKLGAPLPWREAIQLLLPIAEALEYAHDKNMIHRDVKPANILLSQRGQPMLTDFGIAKILDLEETQELTGTNVAVGTPEYMAPEQASAKEVDSRADIYALGIVLYEMVTGRKPFAADTPMAVLIMQARDPLPTPKKFVPDLPDGLEKALLKALAKQPADRYQSMQEFAAALKGLLKEKPADLSATVIEAPRRDMSATATIKSPKVARPAVSDPPTLQEKVRRGKSRAWLWAVGVVALFAIICAGVLITVLPLNLFPMNPGNAPTIIPTLMPIFTRTPESPSTPIIFPTDTPLPAEITDSKGVIMRFVPPGTFVMGSEKDDANEKPAHEVYLDGFYMDVLEVSNARYRDCVDAGACKQPKIATQYNVPSYADYPVIFVDWNMAREYCQWRGGDLPTEAQWEKAARGTDANYYPWGVGINCTLANSSGCVGHAVTVGSYPNGASPYGMLDMAGNVSEWVLDWYLETYYQTSLHDNPLGPPSGIYRVIRDGTFAGLDVRLVRTTIRSLYDPSKSNDHLGIRCARPIP